MPNIKITALFALISAGLTNTALAEEGKQVSTFIEEQNFFSPNDGELKLFHQIKGFGFWLLDNPPKGLYTPLRSTQQKMGLFFRFQKDEKYGQVYGGLVFSHRPWIQWGIGTGAGTGAFLWLGDEIYSFSLITSTTNFKYIKDVWYEAKADIRIDELVVLGAMIQKLAGVGPRLEVTMPNFLKIGLAPLLNLETGKLAGLLSIQLFFQR